TDRAFQPRGKQVSRPQGIWYTPTTGIWQTVWIEPVAEAYVKTLKITPDIDKSEVRIDVGGGGLIGDANISATVLEGEKEVGVAKGLIGTELVIKVPEAKLWTPD